LIFVYFDRDAAIRVSAGIRVGVRLEGHLGKLVDPSVARDASARQHPWQRA
jgi:hypothetical protein